MSDIAIRVENLGKQFRIGATDPDARFNYRTLRETISEGLTSPFARLRRRAGDETTMIWALRNLSFEIRRGEVLGIIGRNGAGKSTLLKILSRVTEPSEGYAEIYGRVGALLEVGTGFHPELSGRENIYLNGAILGMKRSEIERKFDEMVDFAGVEKFIDTPVKRYSTGMYLRLAFSVAAHLEPEILVVDEVLAVGDAEFQQKSLGKMSQVAEEGRTVLFVSHNMSAILRLTQESIVLDQGTLVLRAPTAEAVDGYLTKGFAAAGERLWTADEVPPEAGPFRPIALRVLDAQGHVTDSVRSVDPVTIELEYSLTEAISGLRVGIYVMTVRGEYLFASFDTDDPEKFRQVGTREPGKYISRCRIPANLLNEGRFLIGMNASTFRIKRYFMEERSLTFTVDGVGAPGSQWHELRPGPIRPQLDWQIQQTEPERSLAAAGGPQALERNAE